MFETKVKSEYPCPRCNGEMFAVAKPINVIRLRCETCESEFSVDYVHGWHDGRQFTPTLTPKYVSEL